ncbi:MAG: hypothetical protein AAF311_10095 [Pseudomonadota bacterium]
MRMMLIGLGALLSTGMAAHAASTGLAGGAPAMAPAAQVDVVPAPALDLYVPPAPEAASVQTVQVQNVQVTPGQPQTAFAPAPVIPPVPTGASRIAAVEFRGGRLVQAADTPGRWVETRNDGQVNYEFYQTAASDEMIELTGPQGMVRLFVDLKERVVRGQWPGQTLKTIYTITDIKERKPAAPTPTPQPPAAQPPVTQPPVTQPPVTSPPAAGPAKTPPGALHLATYSGGQFLRTGQRSWQQVTDRGEITDYDQIGFDDTALYLLDRAGNAMVTLEPQSLMARRSGTDQYLEPWLGLQTVSTVPMTPTPPPPDGALSEADRTACLASGGTVERAGILGAERCTRPYGDGGMACIDSNQCQGQCRTDLDTPAGTPVTGVCQANDNPFGCFAEVVAGRAGPGLCVD